MVEDDSIEDETGNDSEHVLWDSADSPARERELNAWPRVLNAVIGASAGALGAAAVTAVVSFLVVAAGGGDGGGGNGVASQIPGLVIAVVLAIVTFTLLAPVLLTRTGADPRLRGHRLAVLAAAAGVALATVATLLLVGVGALVLRALAHLDGSSAILLTFVPVLSVVIPVLALPFAASRVYRWRYARLG